MAETKEAKGPQFRIGEIITIRGGDFKVVGVEGSVVGLTYIGTTKRKPRRAGRN